MKTSRFTDSQIIVILKQKDPGLGPGILRRWVGQIRVGIRDAHRWQASQERATARD